MRCPFAMAHTGKLGSQENEREMENENKYQVNIIPNGPIQVTGKFILKDTTGKVTNELKEVFLCRCGGSKNKPFCDDTHKKIGVRD